MNVMMCKTGLKGICAIDSSISILFYFKQIIWQYSTAICTEVEHIIDRLKTIKTMLNWKLNRF